MNDLLREATGSAGSKQKPHRRFLSGGADTALARLRAQVTPPSGTAKGVYGLHLDAATPGFLVLSMVEAHRPAAPKQAKVGGWARALVGLMLTCIPKSLSSGTEFR